LKPHALEEAPTERLGFFIVYWRNGATDGEILSSFGMIKLDKIQPAGELGACCENFNISNLHITNMQSIFAET
jgi:hypothetical protein